MFSSIKQYLSGSNNSDSYSSYDNKNWQKQKNRQVGNWLTDMTTNVSGRPFTTSIPIYDKEPRFFWNKRNKRNNKFFVDPNQRQPYYDNQPHPMFYNNNNKHLKNSKSHKSLSNLFRINSRSRDYDYDYPNGYADQHHQLNRHSSNPNNNNNSLRRQRHNSLPSIKYNNRLDQQINNDHISNMHASHPHHPMNNMGNHSTMVNGNMTNGYMPNMNYHDPMVQQPQPPYPYHYQQPNSYFQQYSHPNQYGQHTLNHYDDSMVNHHLQQQQQPLYQSLNNQNMESEEEYHHNNKSNQHYYQQQQPMHANGYPLQPQQMYMDQNALPNFQSSFYPPQDNVYYGYYDPYVHQKSGLKKLFR